VIPPVFVDENVGRKIKDALNGLGFDLRTHDDVRLPLGVTDEEWIRAVAERGWAAITADIHQTRRTNEWRAIQIGPLKHVVIYAKKLTADLAVEILDSHGTALKVILDYLPPPYTVKLLKQHLQLKSYHTSYEDVVTSASPQYL
jgi:hypothetical protein